MRLSCVLQRSREYDWDYVEKLRESVTDLQVIEETRWPGWWSKMGLFDPSVKGDLLYFDLDTVIVGPIDDLNTGRVTMLSDFNLPHYVASGVMFLPEAERARVWDEWIKDPDGHMRKHRPHGDGGFLSQFFKQTALRWQDVRPGQIVSYKKHVRKAQNRNELGDGTVPPGARVVCFHGQPRPRAVNWKI